MKRTTIILTLLTFLSACKYHTGDRHRIVESSNNGDSTIKIDSDITNSDDHRQYTNLNFINLNPDYPFLAEDSIIGIGIVTISNSASTYDQKLSIYNVSGNIIATVEHQKNDVVTKYKGKSYHRNDNLNPLSPRLFITNPDYFSLAFDCIISDNDFYTVILNRQTGETAKIKKSDKSYQFETIEAFVERWTENGIDFDRSSNPLRKSPNDKSEHLNNNIQDKYKIWGGDRVSLKGDWLEIKTPETEERGWIRWRRGNQILIRMSYAC